MDKKNKTPNVPNLRFNEFSLPWHQMRIIDLLSFQNGINGTPEQYGKGIKYISVGDILNNDYITYDKIAGSIDINQETLKNYSVTYGDILFQRSSEIKEDIGRTNVYLDKNHTATFGGFVIRGKKIGDYNPTFFNYLLKSPSSRQSIVRLGAGAQHYNIGQENIKTLNFYFPDEEEQQKIANLFSKIDERIQTQIKIISDYNSLKRGITQCIFNTSQQYSSVHLKVILKEISRKNKNRDNNNILSVSNSLGFIKQSEQFEDREIASSDTSNYKIVNKNEYAYNPARINVGSIARLQNFDCGIVSPMYTIFTIDISKITYEYFDLFLQSSTFQKQLSQKLEGSVRQCLTFASMQNILIKLPPLETQIEISGKMKFIDSKIKLESDYLNLLQSEKNHLLKNLFI